MMRILVTADWHLDFWWRNYRDPFVNFRSIFDGLDALVLAGDLANNPLQNWPRGLEQLSRLINPAKVFILPGNHDYYRWQLDGEQRLKSLVEDAGMRFTQKEALELGGVRFLCCTLWTDFCLTGDRGAAIRQASYRMTDYDRIRIDGRMVRPDDTMSLHADHLEWLTRKIQEPFGGRTVIVSHHAPSPCVAGPVDDLTPCFASDLDGWILQHSPDLWMFGHTHRHLSGKVGRTPIVNVSFGYPENVRAGAEVDVLLRGLIDTDKAGLLAREA